jgi:hypothetical protein
VSTGTILTQRDLRLFSALAVTRVLTGDQVGLVAGFSSVRRTNRRLLKLVEAGLLRRWFVATKSGGQRALYGLSREGFRQIDAPPSGLVPWAQDSLITSSQFLDHQQAVNAAFIQAKFQPLPPELTCRCWTTFSVPLSKSTPLVPDAYFEIVRSGEVHPFFLEADLGTEAAVVWKRKTELYLQLGVNGEFPQLFHEKAFQVLVLLPSERRLHSVKNTIAKRTDKLFWFTTQEELERQRLWQPIWLRIGNEEKRCLW